MPSTNKAPKKKSVPERITTPAKAKDKPKSKAKAKAKAKPKAKAKVLKHGQVRPGGRTEQVRKDVASSVLALIQAGRADFSYNEVAEVSGVNKTTLYRRWPQRTDLLREALVEHNSYFQFPEVASWPETVEALIQELAAFLSDPVEMALNIALLSDPSREGNELVISQWQPIQDRFDQCVREAQERGEIAEGVDVQTITMLLMSPVMVLTLFQRSIAFDKKAALGKFVKLMQTLKFPH